MKYRKVAAVQRFSPQGIIIIARGEDGKRYKFTKNGMPSYFFVDEKPEYSPEKMRLVKSISDGYVSIFGKPLWRVEPYKSRDTITLREEYRHYEADVLYVERCCLDMKLTDGFRWENNDVVVDNDVDHIKLKTWTLDIEVGGKTFEEANYKNPVGFTACIVVKDSYNNEVKVWRLDEYASEKDMFINFCNEMKKEDPDIITGWNIDYDVSWIMARMDKLGMDIKQLSNQGWAAIRHWTSPDGKLITKFDIKGRIIFDGLEAYKKKINPSGQLSSYSLKSIVESEGWPVYEDLGAQIYQLWSTRADDIVEYCKKDVDYTDKIISKEKLIEINLLLSRFSGCPVDQTTSKDKIIDHVMLLKRGDKILPSKRQNCGEVNVKGAIVLLPKAGVYNNVGVFDAASLYPSIIKEFNISPETKDSEGKIKITSPEGQVYRFKSVEEEQGLLPMALKDFTDLREKYREQKKELSVKYGADSKEAKAAGVTETSIKFVNTSFYGVNGFKNFRLFDEDCANAITAVGRKVIINLRTQLHMEGFPVLYGDTDSIFVDMQRVENGDEVSRHIKKVIDDTLGSMGVRGDGITVKFEKFFSFILFKQRAMTKKDKDAILSGDALPADVTVNKESLADSKMIAVKKKYIGHCTYSEGQSGKMEPDDYLYVKGFETKRSDTSKMLKKMQKEIFECLKTMNVDKILKIIKDTKRGFSDMNYQEIAIPRKVTKVEANNPWTRGMKLGEKCLEWHYDAATAPRLLYLKSIPSKYQLDGLFEERKDGKIKRMAKCICVQDDHEIPKDFIIDYDVMFDKTVKQKIAPIIDSLGLDWNQELDGQSKLENFF